MTFVKIKYSTLALCTSLIVLFSSLVTGQNITTPRAASPAAAVSQTIGISEVKINYSRPAVKGREIWGKLVPYGYNVQNFGAKNPAPWRAGANENTTIEFSHDVRVEGQPVPKGIYGLFFVINQDNTGEVILSKDYRSWGSFWYDPAHDQMHAKISVKDHTATEILTYDFINLSKNTGDLVLNWENKQFPVKIEFAVNDIVMANAAEELKGPTGFSWQGFESAAHYALNEKVNLETALVWNEKAVSQNKSFNTLNTRSGLLKALGKKEEADKIMADALPLATENDLNNYGYQLINEQRLDKAVEIFILNTQKYPTSANAWDSLGEAYTLKGDKENAIKNFKKSLSLNPPAGTKANSEKFLKQMNAL